MMKKYILVSLIGCMSMSVIAMDNKVAANVRLKTCKSYWNPIINELKGELSTLQGEWDALAPWDRARNSGLFDMLCKIQNQYFSAENARNICFEEGLAKSKEAYDNRW